jgi:hypothetical protein
MSHEAFPNDVDNYYVIRSASSMEEQIDLSIFSMEGLLFKKFEFGHPNENLEYVFDVSELPAGNYYLLIHNSKGYRIERMHKI